ncbi:MAG TPA: choice-of-anchor tandem repeat GloVer-containing protein [Rhizomicrobium sp.]
MAGVAALAALASLGTAHAGITVLYAFTGRSDGAYPHSRLIEDSAGNFHGTNGDDARAGTVFKLAPDGTETTLHTFRGKNGDGARPWAGVIEDKDGNLFGTTAGGGADGYGTVFKLAPDGTETVLYSFTGESDGAGPDAGLIRDKGGNLYGTTYQTNGHYCEFGVDCGGTVFRIAPDGTETVLHSFTGEKNGDGADPEAGLIQDEEGNLYGTTTKGGGTGCKGEYEPNGCGTVFKIAPDGTETVLYAFHGRKHGDGSYPESGLIEDKAGNLYGTTGNGGTHGKGTVFKLAPNGTETVLYSFAGGHDGAHPDAGLIQDQAGNLYGTTQGGGGTGYHPQRGCGTVFMLGPDGTETVLYAFQGHKDGATPSAGLMKGGDGQLYGTASEGGIGCGGFGCGTVFRLTK